MKKYYVLITADGQTTVMNSADKYANELTRLNIDNRPHFFAPVEVEPEQDEFKEYEAAGKKAHSAFKFFEGMPLLTVFKCL